MNAVVKATILIIIIKKRRENAKEITTKKMSTLTGKEEKVEKHDGKDSDPNLQRRRGKEENISFLLSFSVLHSRPVVPSPRQDIRRRGEDHLQALQINTNAVLRRIFQRIEKGPR